MTNMENISTKTGEKMDKILQTISQLHGMNTTMAKMKEEGDDRYKHINEIIADIEKKSPT